MSTLAGNLPIGRVMLKVLLVHPRIPALQNAADLLRQAGVGVVQLEDPAEALQILGFHGRSVDLAVIHREGPGGRGNPGLAGVDAILSDPEQKDLPIVLTSSLWGDAEAVAHQKTPQGVNAYLGPEFSGEQVIGMIGEVLDLKIVPMNVVSPAPVLAPAVVTAPVSEPPSIQLQEVSQLLDLSHQVARPQMTGTFVLESPDVPPAAPPTATRIQVVEPVVTPPPVETKFEVVAPEPALSFETVAENLPDAPQFEPEPELEQVEGESEPESEVEFEVPEVPQPSGLGWAGIAVSAGESWSPGGATSQVASSPDDQTLKQYLSLREQDVAALASQLKLAKSQIQQLEEQLRLERARSIELSHSVEGYRRELGEKGSERSTLEDRHQAELAELRFQLKVKADRVRLLELQVKENTEETERLQERVRVDIRRVRVREKELENRLEVLRKDSEALLAARETKLVELKRKIDLLEFNMDLLQTQNAKEKEVSRKLREQLGRVAQAVRIAGGLLQPGGTTPADPVSGGSSESESERAKGPGIKIA